MQVGFFLSLIAKTKKLYENNIITKTQYESLLH